MRTKIIAGNLIAVLVVGLVSYFVVSSQVESELVADVDAQIERDPQLFENSFELSGLEYADLALELAAHEDSRRVFFQRDEAGQRDAANARANRVADEFQRRFGDAGPPEVVAITNHEGIVVARNVDARRMHGDNLTAQLETLSAVLREPGDVAIDVWRFRAGQEKLLQTVIAPIRDTNGAIIGGLVVGYDMSRGAAERAGELLGRDVAFVTEGEIYASSLETSDESALRAILFGDQRAATTAALGGSGVGQPFAVTLGDIEYGAVIGTVPNAASTDAAYVVLANRSAAADKASPAIAILIMMVLGLVIVLVYGFLIGTSFIKPIEQLEEGVLAVINGRTDLRLEIESAELGGLAYRINQLLNVFTGTPEEDSDGRVSSPPEEWGPEAASSIGTAVPSEASAPSGPAGASGEEDDPELAAKLADEPEDIYYTRVYEEYVAAKQALGENVSNITKDKFIVRLQANEKSLLKKHGCRMVRFQVQTKGTQVNLRPVIIR